jgi:hypothetical protein
MEQARRPALAHHVHRTAPMGPRVLINGIWYKLEAAVRFLKKCRVWVWDRNRGKGHYLTPKEMKELDNIE